MNFRYIFFDPPGSRCFAWNKAMLCFTGTINQHLPEMYPGLLQTSWIERFAIIVDR